jgi:cytochrome c5
MTDTPRWLLAPMLAAGALLLGLQAAQAQAPQRTGKAVVEEQCAKCHAKGEGGAPKVGDRAAWAPRLKQGMDALALSAIRGHGGMPARGSRADLTDGEIKAAIHYMFNPVSAAPPKAAPAKSAAMDRNHKLVAGTDIYLGVIPAETMRARHAGSASKALPPVPSGKGYFHVSVELRDHASKGEVKDAKVEARVANLMTGETKKLEPVASASEGTYANYFRMPGKDPYTVTVKVLKPGAAAPLEAKFDLKR